MLVITRRTGERLRIKCPDGTTIWIKLKKVFGQQASLAFDAPPDYLIHREELLQEGATGTAQEG